MTTRTMPGAGLLLALLLSAGSLPAQSTAQINGTVRDASGGAIPGAEVKATNTGTGSVRTVTTETNGAYVLTNLAIGNYNIEVSKSGFSTAVDAGIVLQVDSNPTLDIALKV